MELHYTPALAGELEAAQSSKSRNYFLRHWRGELSLPVTYWINNILASPGF